jgi:hypothetical protein
MTDARQRVIQLYRLSWNLPHCPVQVAMLEEAVRLADTLNDVDMAFVVRKALMESATFSGRPDVLLVAFSWCLAQFDREPGRFDLHDLLWKYKWVIANAFPFPEIDRPRLEAMLADMERRYREAGSTLNAVWLVRRELMTHFGDEPKAREAHAGFRKSRRDRLSDCPACVAQGNCAYFCSLGQWGRAVQAARPVLQNRLSCQEEPHRTLATILHPLLRLGRLEEAREYQRQGYRLVGRADQFVGQHAEHLEFLALTGEMAQAKRLLERHLPGALASVEADGRFYFLLAARLWADRLASRGMRSVKVRLPDGPPAPGADGKSDVGALGEWFTGQAREIARRFDARNGTDSFARQVDELPELLRLAVD